MLAIDYDILGSRIETPAFAVTQPVSKLSPKQGSTVTNVMLTPDQTTLMLVPIQLTSAWPTQQKYQLTDYQLDTTAWEKQQVRATGDYFIHSLGAVSEPVTSNYVYPRNVGFFVELWCYTQSNKQADYFLFDMSFGQYFSIYLHADGTIELYDNRVGNTPIASGFIAASGTNIIGKYISLMILPYRSGRILISSNLGGYIVANVGSTLDPNDTDDASPGKLGLNVITESAPVSFYNFSTPVASLFNFSPLQYPTTGTLTTPVYQLPYLIYVDPTLNPTADQEMGSSCSLTSTTEVDTVNGSNTLQYTVTLTSGIGSTGITGSNTGSSSSSPTNKLGALYTPFDYYNAIEVDRSLSDNEYTTNTITNPTKAHLVLDINRAQKSFEFTLDNPPAPAEGVGSQGIWTSLKDYENRKMQAYLCTPEYLGLPHNPNDPDYDIIAGNGGEPLILFSGYGEVPDYTDGNASSISIKCTGLRKKLRHFLLSSSKSYDGMSHTDAVKDILEQAGFRSEDDDIDDDHPSEIFIYPDDTQLPSAGSGTEALFRPQDGATSEEFLDLILRFSGWILDDIAGVWYYAPEDYFIAADLYYEGIPVVNKFSLYDDNGITSQSYPNGVLAGITMLADPAPRQNLEEIVANDIWVIGLDDDGNVLGAHYVDEASQNDRTALNWVGERWLFILVSASINSVEAATTVCAILASKLAQPTVHVEFSLPDLRTEFYIDSPCFLDGYGDALIESIDADLSVSRNRTTKYVGRLV